MPSLGPDDKVVVLLDQACVKMSADFGMDVLFSKNLSRSTNRSSIQAKSFRPSDFTKKEFEMILNSECVLGVEKDQRVYSAQTNDPMGGSQKFLSSMNFYPARKLFLSPALEPLKPVLVAVIDSGIDSKHPEFLGRLWTDVGGRIGHNFLDEEQSAEDDFGHGTHVSGLIAANVNNGIGGVGISAQARIMALKTQDEFGDGSVADLISAIRFAVDEGALVINISLSIKADSPGLKDAVDYALERNVVLAVAAGNDATELSVANFFAPAGYAITRPGLISVGSVDSQTGELSDFSNFSDSYIKIAAPGSHGTDHIFSTYIGQGYRALDGTSMSSPIVAASLVEIVSFMKSKNISYTPVLIENALNAGAIKNPKLLGKIKNQWQLDLYGTGRALIKRYQATSTGGFDE